MHYFFRLQNLAKCEENKKKYTIRNISNKSLMTLYKVDDGMIVVDKTVSPQQQKCDFVFCIEKQDMNMAMLVELKGTDISKALKQVDATYELYKSFFDSFSAVHGRIVVTNSTPKIQATPAFVSLQRN